MSEYISLNEVILLASKASECNFRQVPRKKIMFQGQKPNGETITLCSPQSKMHPQGFYWVDITQEQSRVLNETDKGLIFFRLEGRNLLMVKWADLKHPLKPPKIQDFLFWCFYTIHPFTIQKSAVKFSTL